VSSRGFTLQRFLLVSLALLCHWNADARGPIARLRSRPIVVTALLDGSPLQDASITVIYLLNGRKVSISSTTSPTGVLAFSVPVGQAVVVFGEAADGLKGYSLQAAADSLTRIELRFWRGQIGTDCLFHGSRFACSPIIELDGQ
jgi:hypothetical protein